VPARERQHASLLVARNVDRALLLRSHWRIAVYAALPEELDTAPLIALAQERGCRIYLPRIDGIAEPEAAATIGARWLDVVFLPLVGFDRRGVRLGTGGGYYDRAFAFRRWRSAWHAPRLVGLAYGLQQLEHITAAAHDVLMDAVVTEEGIIRCATG